MSKLYNRTQKNIVVPVAIAQNQELTVKERGMILTLLSLPDKSEFSPNELSKILPDGKSSIINTLNSIQNKGYLKKIEDNANECNWQILTEPAI